MDQETVIGLLRKQTDIETQTAIAIKIGVSVQYLNDVLRGFRPPSDKILAYLGLERETVIRKIR